MKKGRFPKKLCLFIIIVALAVAWADWKDKSSETRSTEADYGNIVDYIQNLWKQEPEEVRKLRTREVEEYDAGFQEYYFHLLTDEEKVKACELSVAAGADFVKTSTGFSTGGATPEDVALMKKTVDGKALVKASGGIRTHEDLLRMVEAGADRIGAGNGIPLLG